MGGMIVGFSTPAQNVPVLSGSVVRKKYNAKEDLSFQGDGINDTAAWQHMIDTVQAGATVYFPKGQYRVDLVMSAFNGKSIALEGDGPESEIQILSNQAADGTRLSFKNCAWVRLLNLKITEVNPVPTRVNVYGTVSFDTVTTVKMAHVEVSGSNGAGVHVINSRGRIFGCHVHDTMADGIHMQRGSKYMRVYDNDVFNTADDCIAVVSHDYTARGNCKNIQIRDNRVGEIADTTVTASGITLGGAIGCVVAGNIIRDTTLSGIRVTSQDDGALGHAIGGKHTIKGNQISNTGIYTGATPGVVKDGITVFDQRSVLISKNIISKTVAAGVALGGAGIDIEVSGNLITKAGTRGIWAAAGNRTTAPYLLLWTDTEFTDGRSELYATLHGLVIKHNTIRACGTDGVYVDGNVAHNIDVAVITDNEVIEANVTAAAAYGVFVARAEDVRVKDNTVLNPRNALTASYGYAVNVDYIITGNMPTDNGQYTYIGNSVVYRGAAAPVAGTWKTGDTVLDQNPQPGGPIGWICTAAGTPGTWTQYGTYAVKLAASGALDFPNIVAFTAQELTVAVPGAVAGNRCYANPDTGIEAGLIWSCYVSGVDTVTIRLANITAGDIDPGPRTWRVNVWK